VCPELLPATSPVSLRSPCVHAYTLTGMYWMLCGMLADAGSVKETCCCVCTRLYAQTPCWPYAGVRIASPRFAHSFLVVGAIGVSDAAVQHPSCCSAASNCVVWRGLHRICSCMQSRHACRTLSAPARLHSHARRTKPSHMQTNRLHECYSVTIRPLPPTVLT
jgi:hypothetical protein